MHEWLQRTRDTVADGSGLARAIDYSLKRWPALAAGALRAECDLAGRKRNSADRLRQKELDIHRLRTLRTQRRRDPKPAAHRQTQRPRTCCLA